MKKIKIFIVVLLAILSFAFMTSKVYASELTTEPITTEEVTTAAEEDVIVADSVEETWLNAKDWIMAAVLSVLGLGTASTIGGIILNNLIKKSMTFINDAVAQNKISQATADAATKIINDGVAMLENKFDDFEDKVNEQIGSMDESVKSLVYGFNTNFLSKLNQALAEYFADEEE